MKNLANKLMLIAAGILMLAGIPSPNVQFTDSQVNVSMIGTEVHAHDRSMHACGDEKPSANQLKHASTHCNWWQWAIVGAVLIAAAATIIAAILAGNAASGGTAVAATAATFLRITAAGWRDIAKAMGGAAALYLLFRTICGANANNICDE